jgi:hypothetical protein
VQEVLLNIIAAEHQLLVLGQLNNGSLPSSVVRRNGQGYLQGWDTFAEASYVMSKQTIKF